MNLTYIMLGSIIVFAFCIHLLYLANFSEEKRYKQFLFPLFAALSCFILFQLDERITVFYRQLLGEKWPSLLSYIQLLLNVTFILSFLAVKWSLRLAMGVPLFRRFRWLKKMFYPKEKAHGWKQKWLEPGTISLVYMKSRGLIFLKKEWTYVAALFKWISVLPLILLVLLMAANIYSLSFIAYLPNYPIVSFILLMEIAWFLNGRKFPYGEGSIDGKNAISKRVAVYEELFNQYKEIWPDWLLKDGKVSENELFHQRNHHFSYETLSDDPEHQNIINAICARLKKKNLIIDESYTTILSEIMKEKDVMIEDVIYDEFSAYFFPALYHLLTKNKKLLVIAPSQSTAKEAVEWFSKGIHEVSGLEQVWRVSTYLDALEQNTNSDVLVVSPDILHEKRFLNYLSQLEKTKILEGIIFLHAEKIIPNYSTFIHAFNLNVKELIGKKPQYIILTEWYEGLEHTIRSVLHCEPKDMVAPSHTSRHLHYMVWKKEGEQSFQHTILPKLSHRQLEAEVVLSLPALKANIEPVHFVGQRKTNVKESIQEILDAKKSLFDLGFSLETMDQFLKMIQIHDKNLSIPVEDFSFLLIRDHGCNLVDALNLWKGTGKNASFVHVVCRPYLLRDYLASQLDFYMTTNRTVSPLAPRLSQSNWSIAYYLLERLCHFYISEEEVESYLRRAQIKSYRSIIEGIHLLFTKAFGTALEYRNNIESEEIVSFDRSVRDFVRKTQYRIPYSAREKILPKGLRFIKIVQNNQTISEIFEGHIYQQFLPGQFHSFNGEHYLIQKVDLEHGVVDVSFEPLFEKKYYRPRTKYKISRMETDQSFRTREISFEKFEVSMGAVQADIEIETSGYFELNQLFDLKSMKIHSFAKGEDVIRHYNNGHLLTFQIRLKEGLIEKASEIGFTLSLLLNELFISLFPDTHHFVQVCTQLDDSFFDVNESLSQKLALITPTLQMHGTAVEDGRITLYVIEDSPFHMGILEAIRDNWEKIFDLLDDYLYWLLHESEETNPYLYFGYGHYPKELALAETFTIIDEILTRKKLREVRTAYYGGRSASILKNQLVGETQCVFCGTVYAAAQFHQLDDGRQRCFTCHQSAIDEVSQVEPLYMQVRQLFKEVYNVTLPTDIGLSVLSTADLHKMSGLPFIPEAGNPRLAGKASRDAEGNLKVFIENGSPKVCALSTLAHELTHIWQYENIDVHILSLEELEGFASWVEVHLMEQIGETPYANMLKQQLLIRQDEYGTGYRLILEKLTGNPDAATPFELYPTEAGGRFSASF